MQFTAEDAQKLISIMQNRRDVRGNGFVGKAVEDDKIEMILDAALSAPSVGFSQPWKFVIVDDNQLKQSIHDNFLAENEKAKEIFKASKLYSKLKLEGIKEAPINIAIFYEPDKEAVLGQTSMDQMGEYSVVCAVQNMWLMARALNIGIGWVSILDPQSVNRTLNVPADYKLVAYLCLGYVKAFSPEPELEILGWKSRKQRSSILAYNRC